MIKKKSIVYNVMIFGVVDSSVISRRVVHTFSLQRPWQNKLHKLIIQGLKPDTTNFDHSTEENICILT